jgi:hypothetical protein
MMCFLRELGGSAETPAAYKYNHGDNFIHPPLTLTRHEGQTDRRAQQPNCANKLLDRSGL